MSVGVQREAGVGVTQDAGQRLGVHAAAHGVGCEGVAQIVKANVRQTRAFEDHLQSVIRRAWRRRLLRFQQARKDPLGQRRLAPFLQHMEGAGWQQDRARSFFGFWIAHLQRAAGSRMNGAAYLQRSACLIKVAPLEPADLAAAQAGGDLRVEEIVPQRLGADRFHESVELLFVEDLHGRFIELGDHRSIRRVLNDQPGAHRRFHDLVEQHMDAAHRGIGKTTLASVAGFVCLPTQRIIEFLHVPLRDGAQHFISQHRLDVMTHVTAIPADGALAQRRLGVACEPLLDPLRERPVALLAQIRVAVAVDGAVELRHQLFLRFGEDGFVDRCPVLLVPDDDAAFPASILALADEPVAVRSFPCHVSHFLCNTNTYHNAFGISSENRTLFLVVVAPHDFLPRDLSSRATDVVDRLTAHLLELVITELTDLREHAHQDFKLHRVTEQSF